jgi:serine/threonine-protein kinase
VLSINDLNFDNLAGKEIGTAVLLKELARGGMGVIFTAYQKTLKRQIAVKILPKALLTPWAAELFHQEAESAAILSHPNIIPIYEVGETESFLYFTMQLVGGLPLSQIIKRMQRNILPSRRSFPTNAAIKIVMGVLSALDYAHGQGIIHRDIKPANILIESHTNRPIVTDFGIAKVLRGPEMNVPKSVGTPVYMAPEQVMGLTVDGRADIYPLGVTLFELLVTNLPLPNYDTAQDLIKMKIVLKDRLFQKKPSEMNPEIDTEMDEIVCKALSHDRENRYSSCWEFTEALKNYQRHHGKTA